MESKLLLSLLTASFGALLGTFVGAWALYKFQQRGIMKNRKTAIKALKIFCNYDNKSFVLAENQFNTLNVSEKRAVVVALHKLGVPFKLDANEVFDINEIHFNDAEIDKEEICGMINQVKHGNCDNFFFNDVESYFTDNMRILTARSVAKKYVERVLSHSTIDRIGMKMISPENWLKDFSFGEYKAIQVFRDQVNDEFFFDSQGKAIEERISSLLNDIDIGFWDTYLLWSYEAYISVKSQNGLNKELEYRLKNTLTQSRLPKKDNVPV